MVDAAFTQFGRLDVLVNNAGGGKGGAFDVAPEEHLQVEETPVQSLLQRGTQPC